MSLLHLDKNVAPARVIESLKADGYAIVDELFSVELMDRVQSEMAQHVEASPYGRDPYTGKLTRRTGALIARSPASHDVIMNPLIRTAARGVLHRATVMQLNLTQIITVYPGSPAQKLHQDEDAFDFFPFAVDFDPVCNILVAMTEYTEEMGATRVVPGSHIAGKSKKYDLSDSFPAVMKRGSVLLYTGKVYHGAGSNRSDRPRQAINVSYTTGWLRQEENQYLATPLELARTLPEDLLKLMGYQLGCFSLGYVRDYEDPMVAIKEPEVREVFDISMIKETAPANEHAQKFISDFG